MKLSSGLRMFMIEYLLPLPGILNMRATCTRMRSEHDAAYATGTFSSCGFDKYVYHCVGEV